PPMSTPRSRLWVILLTVFIDLAGFGLILPILPYYAQRFGAGGLGFGALIGVYSLMQFVATTMLGRLSDRVGRRPVLLLSILFSVAGHLVFAFAGSYPVLFLARTVSGFSAGNISVAQAYIADVTSPAERSRGMGLIGAAFGVGFIVGPALGGLAGHFGGPRAAGLAGAGLSLLNLAWAYLVLQESLHAEHRVARRLLDVEHLVTGLRSTRFRALFLVFGLIPFGFSGYMVGLPLYAGTRFGWGEKELGFFFVIVGIMAAAVQGYLFGKLARRFGDRRLMILGTLGMAFPMAAVPFLGSSAALYASVFLLAFANSSCAPALMGLISAFAGPTEQGAMLGAAQSISALGRFSGPFLFGELYDRVGPTTAFLAAGAVLIMAWWTTLKVPRAPST
ncbi:MAG TPA: MFS transporter, partial [Gemmatimonadales bacterium]|nr:MFS transporter [Gemmatimonadales bacterium]